MVDIPANTSTTAYMAGDVATLASYSGTIETFGDVDWIKVSLKAGAKYSFYGALNGYGYQGANANMTVYNSSGTMVAGADDGGVNGNSAFTYTAASTGIYYIAISSSAADLPTGDYTVSATAVTFTAADKKLSAQNDTYTGVSADYRIFGGAGSDTIFLGAGGAFDAFGDQGDDYLDGNAFSNRISGGTGDDTIYGREGNDILFGDGGADYLYGGIGDDFMRGGPGNDLIIGDVGNDHLWGDGGSDLLVGGAGNDWYHLGGDTSDRITDTDGIDTIEAGVTISLVNYATIERLFLTGTAAINGTGNALSNNLQGNAGANALSGGNGNDSIQGNGGADTLTGGVGGDYFVYKLVSDSTVAIRDTITDFKDNGADKIDLRDVYAGTLSFIGTAGFSAAGQVRAVQAGADVNVFVNVNGDTIADMQIVLKGTTLAQVSAGDFVL